jgi:hypothetical protein
LEARPCDVSVFGRRYWRPNSLQIAVDPKQAMKSKRRASFTMRSYIVEFKR